ncbi:hypothetical protein E2562_035255 [Oryza meyeriana var. granulata]|uniref:Uncharacterized protein n=1 Tax=Oryza meyeriana var. granulata TaxID=110450 RepID=A0A6G1F1M6_9ORYZ|nr:hypothetical protein E2562_035255 [Oryza meyeriana var. granulata]
MAANDSARGQQTQHDQWKIFATKQYAIILHASLQRPEKQRLIGHIPFTNKTILHTKVLLLIRKPTNIRIIISANTNTLSSRIENNIVIFNENTHILERERRCSFSKCILERERLHSSLAE